MRVEIVTIGDELLLGYTVDTNAAHLARELAALGIEVTRRATVGDAAEDIAGAVREGLERTGAVITTGGLGPTSDDRTKPAIAALFGRGMRTDEQTLERIRQLWRQRGYPQEMPASNVQQAAAPDGARILVNRHGTAPGIWLEDDDGRWVAMLPGVPREMRGLLADELLPLLRARTGGAGIVVRSRTLRTTGIAESAIADLLGDVGADVGGLALAYLPGHDGCDLRLTCRGLDAAAADAALDAGARALRERLRRHVYGEDGESLAAVVLQLCRERGWHIAVAESCTGGLLGARLTAVPGASDVVRGGVIAYDNLVKERLLGVASAALREHGAVSEVVVRRMATAAREQMDAEVGLGITGVAGPGGGTPEKPVGTVWVAADVNGDVRAHRRGLPGDREEIRYRAAQMTLDLLRRALTP